MSLATCSSHGVRKTNVTFPSRSMISASSQLGRTDQWSKQRVTRGALSRHCFVVFVHHTGLRAPQGPSMRWVLRFHDLCVSHVSTEVAQCRSCPQSLGHQGATQPLCKRSHWDLAQTRGRQLPVCSCSQPHPEVASRPPSGSAERSAAQNKMSKFVTSA